MIVVATYRAPERLAACLASLEAHEPDEPVMVVDNGIGESGYETGALLQAYAEAPEAEDYLLLQDSMLLTRPILDVWRALRENDARTVVALAAFPLNWDNVGQIDWLAQNMPPAAIQPVPVGIFGNTMLVPRVSLDALAAQGLLPPVPRTKSQAAATERQWSMSFAAAGIPVAFAVQHYRQLIDGVADVGVVKTFMGRA